MNWARVCLWFAFVAILSLPGARVHAQPADSPEIGDLQIGFADAYKIGHWTPLAVALHNTHPAAIHGDFHRARQLDVADNAGNIILRNVVLTIAAVAFE